jgi:hypothetical protein
MSEALSAKIGLDQLLKAQFPVWLGRDGHTAAVSHLGPRPAEALENLLRAELAGKPSYALRAERYDDLTQFDFKLNQITGSLLREVDASRTAVSNGSSSPPSYELDSSLFAGGLSSDDLSKVVATLNKDGYCPSPVPLNREQIDRVLSALRLHNFASKGPPAQDISGADLLEKVAASKTPNLDGGDTFWLTDQDAFVRDGFMLKLAFDPFITAVATEYFGCAPVHVQTNAWFSFPSGRWTANLSSNAQMYHQDKEFVKFLKVFIYLSDVDENSGPHGYVEGSHHDELHRKGQTISGRVSDADIGNYYDVSRIRSVTGPAGLVMFGDTSCVHKGTPVLSGYRAILQLEYAMSLYLSPVSPFTDLPEIAINALPYPGVGKERLVSNYSSKDRQAFLEFERRSAPRPIEVSGLRSLVRKARRRILSLVN